VSQSAAVPTTKQICLLVFGSGAEPVRANIARNGLTESPMERDYDAQREQRGEGASQK